MKHIPIPPELHAELKAIAKERGMVLHRMIAQFLSEQIKLYKIGSR